MLDRKGQHDKLQGLLVQDHWMSPGLVGDRRGKQGEYRSGRW